MNILEKKLVEIYKCCKINHLCTEKALKDLGVNEEPGYDKMSSEKQREVCSLIAKQEASLELMMELEDFFNTNKINPIVSLSIQ